MVVECPYCELKVDGKVIASHLEPEGERDPGPIEISFLECPSCKHTLVASHYLEGLDEYDRPEWSNPSRLWPRPKRYFSLHIPASIRSPLEEAERCYKAKAYFACAVMCGRTLEAICHHFKTSSNNLATGLKELLDRQIIDRRIYQWGEELRKHRNIGAHISQEQISGEDADYLLDFVAAICEYVFVLNVKFEKFIKSKRGTAAENVGSLGEAPMEPG